MIIHHESAILKSNHGIGTECVGTFTRAYYVDFDNINKTITVNGVNNEIKPLSEYTFFKDGKNIYGNYEKIKEILLDFAENGVKALFSGYAEMWLDVFAGKTVAKIYKKERRDAPAWYDEIFD